MRIKFSTVSVALWQHGPFRVHVSAMFNAMALHMNRSDLWWGNVDRWERGITVSWEQPSLCTSQDHRDTSSWDPPHPKPCKGAANVLLFPVDSYSSSCWNRKIPQNVQTEHHRVLSYLSLEFSCTGFSSHSPMSLDLFWSGQSEV